MLQPHLRENPGAGTPGLEGHTKNPHWEITASRENTQRKPRSEQSAAEVFRAVMLERLGSAPSEIICDGKIHRFTTGKPGRDDAGWYVLHNDDFPAGSFGDWRTGDKFEWRARETLEMSQQERERLEELKAERQKKTAAAYEAAATGQWNR